MGNAQSYLLLEKNQSLPKSTYILQNTPYQKEYLNILNSLYFKFVWGYESEKNKTKNLNWKENERRIRHDCYTLALKVKCVKCLKTALQHI